MKFMI